MPLPLLVAAAPAIFSAGKGAYDIISGNSKYDKAKKEMESLTRPFYKIQDEYNQNRNIAANRASQGYSDAELNYLTNENERGLGAGISALSQGGGGSNDLAKILDTYNRTAARTAAEDAQVHTQNIAAFFNANKDLAGQKTIQWHENEYQPWADKQSLLSNQMNIAQKTKDQGWNSIISGISGALTAGINKDMLPPGVGKAIGGTGGFGFTPNKIENAYAPSGATDIQPAPQQVSGRNSTYDALMNGGVKLGTDQYQYPVGGYKQPTDLNFDVNKMIWQ